MSQFFPYENYTTVILLKSIKCVFFYQCSIINQHRARGSVHKGFFFAYTESTTIYKLKGYLLCLSIVVKGFFPVRGPWDLLTGRLTDGVVGTLPKNLTPRQSNHSVIVIFLSWFTSQCLGSFFPHFLSLLSSDVSFRNCFHSFLSNTCRHTEKKETLNFSPNSLNKKPIGYKTVRQWYKV